MPRTDTRDLPSARAMDPLKKRFHIRESKKDDAAGDVRRGYQEPDRKITHRQTSR